MKAFIAVAFVLEVLANTYGVVEGSEQATGISLEFVPKPTADRLIEIKSVDRANVKVWTDTIGSFLQGYKVPATEEAGHNIINCDFSRPPWNGRFCAVNLDHFGPCSAENLYGFHQSKPCIYLTPNKVLNWIPEPYTIETLPVNMTADLKEFARNAVHKSVIWVSCEGESPADQEFIGPLRYYPSRGFPAYFYPYTGVEGYLSPLVAVQFERAQVGVVISVECRMWAQNIPYDRERQLGSVRFQLLID